MNEFSPDTPENKKAPETRCGFVSVIGLPNVGKSTFVNTFAGGKVSIVSHKVQTTRARVLGMRVHKGTQIILMDTPGIFEPKKTLEKAMVKAAWDSVPDADIILHMVDASRKSVFDDNTHILKNLPEKGTKTILVVNKTDRIQKEDLLPLVQKFNSAYDYAATFMISALKEKPVEDVADYLAKNLPEGPYLYEEDQMTDIPMRLMAAEITREKIFHKLHQELPYAIMVYTEKWEDFKDGSVKIEQTVLVQRDSQKGIVLGKGGAQIKTIGEAARKELEHILGTRVHLKLFVKVQSDWAEREENFKLMGLIGV